MLTGSWQRRARKKETAAQATRRRVEDRMHTHDSPEILERQAPTWRELAEADPRVELLALNMLALGPSPRDRAHPRRRLPSVLAKLRRLVGPGRRSRFGPEFLRRPEALEVAEAHLRELAEGGAQ